MRARWGFARIRQAPIRGVAAGGTPSMAYAPAGESGSESKVNGETCVNPNRISQVN